MTVTHFIEVTQQDIEAGRQCESGRCPIALAVMRSFPGFWASVSIDGVRLWDERGERRLTLPWHVGEAISLYDRTGVMEPMAFELSVAGIQEVVSR